MSRSRWEFVRKEGDIVFIRDLDLGGRSVTNDADLVFEECRNIFGSCRVVYQDSEGEWAEIVKQKTWLGEIGFRPWHGLDWDILSRK